MRQHGGTSIYLLHEQLPSLHWQLLNGGVSMRPGGGAQRRATYPLAQLALQPEAQLAHSQLAWLTSTKEDCWRP